MKRVRKATFWFVLFIYLFVGSRVSEGFVLCFGADGHIAVEPSHSELFGASSSWPSHPVSSVPSIPNVVSKREKHVSPCVDIPLSIANLDRHILFENLSGLSVSFDIMSISDRMISQDGKLWEKVQLFSSPIKTPFNSSRALILLI